MKKIASAIALVALSFTVFSAPVYAQGDPVEEKPEMQGLQENPVEEPKDEVKREDDHTPISYDGTGTVKDNILNGSKQFYTIATDDGNVFYLIIDLDKEYNNVYFLDTTKERDLIALAEEAEGIEHETIEEPVVPKEPEPVVEEEDPEPVEPVKTSHSSLWITLILILIAGAGVFFYYKIYKPRKDEEEAEEFEEAYSFEEESEPSFDDDSSAIE